MKKLGLTLTVLFLATIFSSQSFAKENYWQLANTYEKQANTYLQKGKIQGFYHFKALEIQYLRKFTNESSGTRKAEAYLKIGIAELQLSFTQNGLRDQAHYDAAKKNFQLAVKTKKGMAERIAHSCIDFGKSNLANFNVQQLYAVYTIFQMCYPASLDYLISSLEAEPYPTAAAILYIYTGKDEYRELMFSRYDLDSFRGQDQVEYAYSARPDPKFAEALGNFYAEKVKSIKKTGKYDGLKRYQEKAKHFLSDEQYQAHFPKSNKTQASISQKTSRNKDSNQIGKQNKVVNDKVQTEIIENIENGDIEVSFSIAKKEGLFADYLSFLNHYKTFKQNSIVACNSYYASGDYFFNNKKYETALHDFDFITGELSHCIQTPEVYLKKGLAFESLGRGRDAYMMYRKVVEQFPDNKLNKIAADKLVPYIAVPSLICKNTDASGSNESTCEEFYETIAESVSSKFANDKETKVITACSEVNSITNEAKKDINYRNAYKINKFNLFAVIGSIEEINSNSMTVVLKLFDIKQKKMILGKRYSMKKSHDQFKVVSGRFANSMVDSVSKEYN